MTIWKKEISPDRINQRCQNTLVDHLGITFVEVGKNFLIAKMKVDQKVCQPMNILHGGATAALAETVASAAANYCLEEGFLGVGLDLNINHLRPVKSGFIFAKTKPFHLGKKTQVWEILIQNENEQLIAVARLTIAVIVEAQD